MARKTNLTLVDMLLEQAENLTNDELTPDEIQQEIKKADALSKIAEKVVDIQEAEIHDLAVKVNAVKTAAEVGYKYTPQGLQLEELPDEKILTKRGYLKNGLPFEE